MRIYHQQGRTATLRMHSGGRPCADELERRQAKVLDVASDLFVMNGYAATSLLDITAAAGVSGPLVHRHIGDKETVFHKAIRAGIAEIAPVYPELQPDDTLWTVLLRTARCTEAFVLQPRVAGLMRLLISESQRFPDFTRTCAAQLFGGLRQGMEKLFSDLVGSGVGARVQGELLVDLFTAVVLGGRQIMALTRWIEVPRDMADIQLRVELFMNTAFDASAVEQARTRVLVVPIAAKPKRKTIKEEMDSHAT